MLLKLTDVQKRIVLFLVVCIGIRLLFVLLAKNVPLIVLQLMGIIAIMISVVFMYSALFKYKKGDLGVTGGKVWWNELRIFHSITYGLFAYLALTKNQNLAWRILLFDVIVGFVSFMIHYAQYLI
jgi:hypothetical protein